MQIERLSRTARFTEAEVYDTIIRAKAAGPHFGVEIPPGPNPEIKVIDLGPEYWTRHQGPRVEPVVQTPRLPRDNGWVYFIRAIQTGRIKIGFSSCPERRLRELEMGCPVDLELICKIPGCFDSERDLHKRFAAHRARGEWFLPAPELTAYIAEILK